MDSDHISKYQGLLEETKIFHTKIQIVESFTPAALALTLFYGAGNIIVLWAEFQVSSYKIKKNVWKKCQGCLAEAEKADMIFFLCRARMGGRINIVHDSLIPCQNLFFNKRKSVCPSMI